MRVRRHASAYKLQVRDEGLIFVSRRLCLAIQCASWFNDAETTPIQRIGDSSGLIE